MMEALRTVLWPMVTPALLEITGSVSLGFIHPIFRDIFFRLTPIVLALGLIHAFIIFPSVISLFFELMESCYSENEVDTLVTVKKQL